LEFKAIDHAPEATLSRALRCGAVDHGLLRQRDTFFAAANGRLKLREETPGHAHLIQYMRPDSAEAKVSRYRLVEVGSPETMRAALSEALGVRCVVTKLRRLLLVDHIRIHLDTVDDLGSFVEVEAVVPAGGRPEDEASRVRELRERLGVSLPDLVQEAYADLLAGHRASASS
jgi:predicted adenylyl cyclase CyaB